jgi:trans-aconitate methyltransferase
MSYDVRGFSEAAQRNIPAILEVLSGLIAPGHRVLEVASGTGQHAAAMAQRFPLAHFEPTEASADRLPSIAAWLASVEAHNASAPRVLDVTVHPWAGGPYDVAVVINLVQVLPTEHHPALFRGLANALAPAGALALYSPLSFGGVHVSPSNAAFHEDLRLRDPRYGVRDSVELCALAREVGLELEHTHPMPSNNTMLVFRRAER